MISRASLNDLHLVAPLFDLYRQFYSQASDLQAATSYLSQRISNNESVIFLALENQRAVGFVQLYPVFSSIGMKRSWILNDLFVLDSMRGNGIGEKLINEAVAMAKSTGASSISLETAVNNPAQKLYERLGWKKSGYLHYEFSC